MAATAIPTKHCQPRAETTMKRWCRHGSLTSSWRKKYSKTIPANHNDRGVFWCLEYFLFFRVDVKRITTPKAAEERGGLMK
jgi:hypothetical protein